MLIITRLKVKIMINKNDFILALYTYKLFGESLDKVYGVLSQKLGLNKNQASQLITNLSKKGIVEIKDNIITHITQNSRYVFKILSAWCYKHKQQRLLLF